MTTWHLLLGQCFVSHFNLNVNQCYFLSDWKNNLAPWKTFFFAAHLTFQHLSVCPSVLLPTHERLAWPPPVPSRHQLIYQNTWTDLLVLSTGFIKCSSRPLSLYTVKREIPVQKQNNQTFQGIFFVIRVYLGWHADYYVWNNNKYMFCYYCRWIGN